MPVVLNWLLRLLPTNPICMRLVQGGSKRLRHLYIRVGYLGALMAVLLLLMLGGSGANTFSELARNGAQAFDLISYLQLGLICLLTPVFMAGAIAQEANPRTWDILLTTPLNNLQIVLGNMFGRLFFILALLLSTLPLFVAIQYFGGVPGESIFLSYLIAGASAMVVAAIAVTLSVTRTAGRRAVFLFYITVVMYLFITYAADSQLRQPVAIGSTTHTTTLFTPINPFLVLEVLLRSNTYTPHVFTGGAGTTGAGDGNWLSHWWLGNPIAAFVWVSFGITAVLVVYSTIRLRVIGGSAGVVPLWRRVLRLGAKGATERPPRKVSHNPIVWREAVARGATGQAMLIRWGFAAGGLLVAIVLLTLFHTGMLGPTSGAGAAATAATFRGAIAVILAAEIVIIGLAALNMSATAVSKEREDGSLDILLTTPIQPGPYIYGKLRGLVQFLVPMICVPVGTLALISLYILLGGFGGNPLALDAPTSWGVNTTITMPIVLPEGAIALPLSLVPFIAFCVMVGLQWSIKSKGTIGSVIAAVAIVIAIGGVVGLCGAFAGRNMDVLGAVMNAFLPINLVAAVTNPHVVMESALGSGFTNEVTTARIAMMFGAVIAATVFVLVVYGMHQNMKRTFHMTVRKLAGAK
jgi:ABC-type transport system involved in multi-copper enzyme maturation permease subunit